MLDAPLQFRDQLARAKTSACTSHRPVLASWTWEIPPFDACSLIQQTEMSHYYFLSPDRKEELFGCGDALVLRANGPRRFETLQQEWGRYTNGLTEHIHAFSGFSFNPHLKTEKWAAFGEAALVVPSFLYRRIGTESTLTCSTLVRADDDIDHLFSQFLQSWKQLNVKKHSVASNANYTLECRGEDTFAESFEKAQAHITSGELQKLVISREVVYSIDGSPFPFATTINQLIDSQLGSYVYLYRPRKTIGYLGATPERLIKKENERAYTAAIAGTIRRPDGASEQERAKRLLLTDKKNHEEHDIVVQDITRALRAHTNHLETTNGPVILENRSMFHLHTPIRAYLNTGVSLLHLVRTLHPTPALGGAPKQQAIEALMKIEPFERGWYGSPFGWLDNHGNGEYVVAIRSALVNEQQLTLYAGCGIVRDSTLQSELEETETKLNPIKQALGLHEQTIGDIIA